MKYTLGQAAKATGKSKSTISAAIKSGRISGSKDEAGAYAIDPAELHRVFEPNRSEQGVSNETAPLKIEKTHTSECAAYDAQIKLLRELLDEVRSERDHLRQLQIADQRKAGLWDRIFGKRAA